MSQKITTPQSAYCPAIPLPVIAVVGNPNCGKTTLFNALTGTCQQTGNWAGVTVERKSGYFRINNTAIDIIDLPGTYSLTTIEDQGPQDERITSQYLKSTDYSLVLNVVDALHCERNLYLTLQCLEEGLPVVIALNRIDLLKGRGEQLDSAIISKALNCPVIPIVAREGVGIEKLKQVLSQKINQQRSATTIITYPPLIESIIKQLAEKSLAIVGIEAPRYQIIRWLEGETPADNFISLIPDIAKLQKSIVEQLHYAGDIIIAKTRYDFIENLLAKAKKTALNPFAKARAFFPLPWLDKITTHRFLGLPVFLLGMYALFFFAIQVGGSLQPFFEAGSHAIFVEGLNNLLAPLLLPPWLMAILVSGMGKGISTVITFIPVIGAMFLALSFLEDCGYMARAVFVVDRIMRAIGLPGKSLVPMIVGFGCNVPAIMGMRTLSNKRDRILAVMMSPFMSCGARLAIFTVFVAAFFPTGGPNIVFLLYLIGIAMAVVTGLILKKTLLRGENTPLIMEMPDFQWPHWQSLFMHSWNKLSRFVINAGKLIIPVCIIVGSLNSITIEGKWVNETQDSTLLSYAGKKLVPLFEPMGIEEENWPAVVGLLTGILAKEVVIGTLNSLYSPQEPLAEPNEESFHAYGEMVKRFHDPANAFAYLLFVLLYFPCVSATAAMVREVQRGWTIFSVCWTTSLAYAMAVGYYQLATFDEHPLQSGVWITALLGVGILAIVGIRHYSAVYIPRNLPTKITLI